MDKFVAVASLTFVFAICGCEKSQEKPTKSEETKPVASTPPVTAKPAESKNVEKGPDGRDQAGDEKPAAPGGRPGHSGEVIELGTTKIGVFEVRASREKGEIKPGGDAPVDVWIDGGVGKGVTAVRFWVGVADAKGSIKAKADIEDGKWHTHVEVPSPIPAETKLWVEIEEAGGKKSVGSIDLKN